MKTWFEIKVKYKIITEDGSEKAIIEEYIVDALSFTEAESRINTVLEPFQNDDYLVTNMKRSNYTDYLMDESGEEFFKTKIEFAIIDEDSGKEKKTINYILIQANDLEHALQNLKEAFKEMTINWESTLISKTKLVDVLLYLNEQQNEEIPEIFIPDSEHGLESFQDS